MYTNKKLIEDKMYQIIDPFNEKKNSHINFNFTLFNNIHPLYDGNERTYKILFLSSCN